MIYHQRILLFLSALVTSVPFVMAEQPSYNSGGNIYYRPPVIQTSNIAGFDKLSDKRKKLLVTALEVARKNSWLKYKFGGADPVKKGFDCSGAMYYVLRKAGYQPPRTSAQQYVWIRDAKQITLVSERPETLDDPMFSNLMPGDLLFWSGTYKPTDGRKVSVSHVSMYLGQELDGHHVMIGASKGRSYRGKRGDGYGVYDFKLPSAQSSSRFVGYGSPVGVK